MECKRCGNILTGKQTSYCSRNCSKLHLKSLYKKRRRELVNAYNRQRRSIGASGASSNQGYLKEFMEAYSKCAKCDTGENLDVCHIKPRDVGGKQRDNLIVFCHKHHSQFDRLLWEFWHPLVDKSN